MISKPILFIITIAIAHISADRAEDCWTKGACLQSVMIDSTGVESATACENFCGTLSDCSWFTFYADQGLCTALTQCIELSDTIPNTISGNSKCNGEPNCDLMGRCTGVLVSVATAETPEACQQICQSLNSLE